MEKGVANALALASVGLPTSVSCWACMRGDRLTTVSCVRRRCQGAGAPSQCKLTLLLNSRRRARQHLHAVYCVARDCSCRHCTRMTIFATTYTRTRFPQASSGTAYKHTEAQSPDVRGSVCVFAGRLGGGYGAAAPSPPGACSASAATAAGRPTTTRSLATTTRPGGAPRGLLTSLARATVTAGLPSLRALEKKAARLAAKMTSSCGASLRARRAQPRAARPRRAGSRAGGAAPRGRHAQHGVGARAAARVKPQVGVSGAARQLVVLARVPPHQHLRAAPLRLHTPGAAAGCGAPGQCAPRACRPAGEVNAR
jgi:hypothetical protein